MNNLAILIVMATGMAVGQELPKNCGSDSKQQCVEGHSITDTTIASSLYVMAETGGYIAKCDYKDFVPYNCVLMEGHTLDELMRVMAKSIHDTAEANYQSNRTQLDRFSAAVDLAERCLKNSQEHAREVIRSANRHAITGSKNGR